MAHIIKNIVDLMCTEEGITPSEYKFAVLSYLGLTQTWPGYMRWDMAKSLTSGAEQFVMGVCESWRNPESKLTTIGDSCESAQDVVRKMCKIEKARCDSNVADKETNENEDTDFQKQSCSANHVQDGEMDQTDSVTVPTMAKPCRNWTGNCDPIPVRPLYGPAKRLIPQPDGSYKCEADIETNGQAAD